MEETISSKRKKVFYLGRALSFIGGILFLSCFVTFFLNWGDFTDFNAKTKSFMGRGFIGIFLLIIGGFISRVGARGLAGSGVILNPSKARQDLKPYSQMVGGMVGDAISAARLNQSDSENSLD